MKLIKKKNQKINEDEILFYTTEKKLGKLYQTFIFSDFKNNKKYIFDINKISKNEFHKLSNPILDFK